jgi:hypothetical protein
VAVADRASVRALALLIVLAGCARGGAAPSAAAPTASLAFAKPAASESATVIGCSRPSAPQGMAPAKPVGDELSLRPVGPLDDGFAVVFYSLSGDGPRSWACALDASGRWHGIPLPAEAGLDEFGAVSDGRSVAMRAIGDDIESARLVIAAANRPPLTIALADAGDAAWLDDWRFWGHLEPIPGGGFLLAGGTRLAVVDEGRLELRPLPAGMTPLGATSEAGTWLLGPLDGRHAGGISDGRLLLWREGGAAPQPIEGEWIRWLPASEGLVWLRARDHWSRLRRDGALEPLPANDAAPYGDEIAPDGSAMLLVRGDGCAGDTPSGCDVAIADPRSGAKLLVLPTLGSVRWGPRGGIFVTELHPSLGIAPRVFLVSPDQKLSEVPLPLS